MVNERKKIGGILLAAGLISQGQLEKALQIQAESGDRLGEVFLRSEMATEEGLARAISEQLGLPRVNPAEVSIPDDVLELIPRNILRTRQVVPLERRNRSLTLAMTDPLDYMTISEIEFRTSLSVDPVVTTATEVMEFLTGKFGGSDHMHEALKSIRTSDQIEILEEESEGGDDILTLRKAGEAAPVVSMVNMILSEAIKGGASDVHIEPREKDLLVRYRIDGLLRDMTTLPSYVHPSIISRVKIMAKMDIAVRRRPQDGGTKIRMGEREVDLRISTLPTLYGEKMVIRILDKSQSLRTLEELGMLHKDLELNRSFLNRPQGMILVTGPTGSGKTTSLYASLLYVRSEGVNIITIEDPIEYQISGVNQVQVNNKAGISFATGLRSILRQDPNIIMVGEIRDKETAEIAFQASLTGHLVLSTLHTNNAVSAITRLMDIGVEPYLVASSVVGVVAQRLVRTSCSACQISYDPDPGVFKTLGISAREAENMEFKHGEGCRECHLIGYRGRTGIYEILAIDDTIRELIINRASERRILDVARSQGMTTMEDVARAAGLSRATVYRYFKNRDDLLMGVVEREARSAAREIEKRLCDIRNPGEYIVEGIVSALVVIPKRPALSMLFLADTVGVASRLLLTSERMVDIALELLLPVIEPARQNDLLRENVDTRLMIEWIFRIISSYLTVPSPLASNEEEMRALLRIMLLPALLK